MKITVKRRNSIILERDLKAILLEYIYFREFHPGALPEQLEVFVDDKDIGNLAISRDE